MPATRPTTSSPTAVDRNFAVNGTSTHSADCAASSNNINSRVIELNGSTTHASTVPTAQSRGATQVNSNYYRPYPGYTSINTGVSIGSANYNGLQTGFIYRLTDLQLNAAYTYSKALGNQNQSAQGNLAYGFDSNIGFQNPRNPGGDYGRPSYDRTNVFTSAYVYELPFFRHSSNFLAREFLSHWGTSGLITAQSGFTAPVSLSSPYAGLATRPNIIGTLVRNHGSGKKAIGQPALYNYTVVRGPRLGHLRQLQSPAFCAAPRKSASQRPSTKPSRSQSAPDFSFEPKPSTSSTIPTSTPSTAPSRSRPPPTPATSATRQPPATCARWSSPPVSPSNQNTTSIRVAAPPVDSYQRSFSAN